MKIRLFVLLVAVLGLMSRTAWADEYELLADSSNFVKSSIVVVAPGRDFYSNLGHLAIRIECPTYDYDYCFSFGTNDDTESILRFFAGDAEGCIIGITTDDFLDEYSRDEREVTQWTLNLSLHEQQRLCQLLEQDMVGARERKFNFVQNNCTSIALYMLEQAMLDGDHIQYVWPEVARNCDNATGVCYITRGTPWMQFVCLTLLGTEGEQTWDNRHRMSPELVVPLLHASSIVGGNGASRPVLTGESMRLVVGGTYEHSNTATPNMVFALLLTIVVVLTFGTQRLKRRGKLQRLCVAMVKTMDVVLLTGQTLAGLALLYMSFVSGLFGVHWNWLLVPLNPLPLLLWIVFGRCAWWSRIYMVYVIVLAMFMLYSLTLSTIILPHILMTTALLVWCVGKILDRR